MTYSEAIEQVMLKNGYFAPLKLIYKEIWKYKNPNEIKGKTPINTIQERVQRDERFTKIGYGVYALTNFLDKMPKEKEPITDGQKQERLHAKIQGMLLEIGNQEPKIAETYTNDKKWIFDSKTLGSLATIQKVPPFTYEKIINESVTFADVIWFNERMFPEAIFEVEQSTDFRDAFVKFMELQDFQTKFYCISQENRQQKFEKEIEKVAFRPIRNRIKFLTYENVITKYDLACRIRNTKLEF